MLNNSGGMSDSTPYFKVYIHEPVKSCGNSIYFHAFVQPSLSGVQHEKSTNSYRAMQMPPDAPKLLPNLLTLTVEDMMHMKKSVRKSKNFSYNKKSNISYATFLLKIQLLRLYRPHMGYEKKEFSCVRLLNTNLTFQCLETAT